ncbi:isopentenyl-diphosphate delta-isomerase [Maritimibacter sp. 55A14]|uniref:isopentenyl-diphosphate Delta-isomerase n=1 Tax=Maritimibacter sp. 55A14 TaxID=2174844 RepID=UPI000D616440|nr:isopentenyl-diphosphate Delta-isomerase [Maritimibacter sp. 55A14]PWE33495.1 isopentenyl-diphosphate delta-isomerase [Maritimibacter sp. 55A14]
MTEMIPAWVNGELTPVEKLEAHRTGLRHKAVSVFLMHGAHLLIQRRALGKYHTPGLWANTCCTHPHWDEDPRDCAIRRLRQELGITDIAPHHRDRVEYRADVGGGLTEHELVDIYLATVGHRIAVAPDPAEVMETRWITLNALRAGIAATPERFTPWLRIYLAEHSDRIFGLERT